MKTLTLTLRDQGTDRIDLSSLRLDELRRRSDLEIEKLTVATSCGSVELGERFHVVSRSHDGAAPTLILQGNCRQVDSIGHQHRVGRIIVEGDVGDYCGSCMSGGTICVQGDAGNHLGGAWATRGVGMNGGILSVQGRAGDFVGHRMRRGEIRVAGHTGDSLAAWQVAGTIRIGGQCGENVAYGMRRGTLVLMTAQDLPALRFSKPVGLETPFRFLLSSQSEIDPPGDNQFMRQGIREGRWVVRRGDRSIGGIGEVWLPG